MAEKKWRYVATPNEMIGILNTGYAIRDSGANTDLGYIVFTNYPYVYKKSNLRVMGANGQHTGDNRILYIPGLTMHCKESLRLFKMVLLNDAKAPYNETLRLMGCGFDSGATTTSHLQLFRWLRTLDLSVYANIQPSDSPKIQLIKETHRDRINTILVRNATPFQRNKTEVPFVELYRAWCIEENTATASTVGAASGVASGSKTSVKNTTKKGKKTREHVEKDIGDDKGSGTPGSGNEGKLYRQLQLSIREKHWEIWNALITESLVLLVSLHAVNYHSACATTDAEYMPLRLTLSRMGIYNRETLLTKINAMILRNTHETKNLTNIPLKNGSIKDQLQGRRSHMRRKIASPKIMTMRCQIGLRFDLAADEIIIPVNILDRFKPFMDMSSAKNDLFNLADPTMQKSKFTTLSSKYAFLLKRDPVIHQNSVVCVSKFAMAETDLFYISPHILHGQNADFDGDAENLCIVENDLASQETRLYLQPDCNVYNGFVNIKLHFSETHIYYMHRRVLSENHRYHKAYLRLRDLMTLKYLGRPINRAMIREFILTAVSIPGEGTARNAPVPETEKIPLREFLDTVEPTSEILQTFALNIYMNEGSMATVNWFNEVNEKILDISNGLKSGWYDESLDGTQHIVPGKLINKTLCKIVMSGAKGSPEHYTDIIKLSNEEVKKTQNVLQHEVDNAMSTISASVKRIPEVGHSSFKSLIEWNALRFSNNKLYYNKTPIVDNWQEFLFANQIFNSPLSEMHFMDNCTNQ